MNKIICCLFILLSVADPSNGQSSKDEFIQFCNRKHVSLAKKLRTVEFFELRREASGSTSWRNVILDGNLSLEMIWPNSDVGGRTKTGKRALLANVALGNSDYFAYLAAVESTRTESTPQNPLGVSWHIQMFNDSPDTNDCILQYCYMLPRSGLTYKDLVSLDNTDVGSWIRDDDSQTGTVVFTSDSVPKVSGMAEVTAIFDLTTGACKEMTISGEAPPGMGVKTASIRHVISYSQMNPVPVVEGITISPNFAEATKSEVHSVNFEPEYDKRVFRLPFYGLREPVTKSKSIFDAWWFWTAIATVGLSIVVFFFNRSRS